MAPRYPTIVAGTLVLAVCGLMLFAQIFLTSGLDTVSLLSLIAYPVFLLLALMVGFGGWRSHRWRAFLPAMVLGAGVGLAPLAARLGNGLRERWFRDQLPQLESVIRARAPHPATVSMAPYSDQVPPAARASCRRLMTRTDSLGQVTGTCIASRRLAYLYRPGAQPAESLGEPFAPGWYRLWH